MGIALKKQIHPPATQLSQCKSCMFPTLNVEIYHLRLFLNFKNVVTKDKDTKTKTQRQRLKDKDTKTKTRQRHKDKDTKAKTQRQRHKDKDTKTKTQKLARASHSGSICLC